VVAATLGSVHTFRAPPNPRDSGPRVRNRQLEAVASRGQEAA